MTRIIAGLVAVLFATVAIAQWQTPDHSIPVGNGAGTTGFGSVGPCASNVPIVGAGTSSDPICATSTYLTPAPGQFYANASTGSDSNDCLAASSGGGHGPCLTVQHAINVASGYPAGNSQVTVNLSGSFTAGAIIAGPLTFAAYNNLSPAIVLDGGSSSTTTIDDTTANCWTLLMTGGGTNVILKNLKLKHSSGSSCASLIFAQINATVLISSDVDFSTTSSSGQHIHAETGARVEITAAYKISGNAGSHWGASTNGSVLNDGYTVTCSGSPAFTSFYYADTNSALYPFGSPTYTSCGSVTGRYYDISGNSTLSMSSSSDFANIPGNNAGHVRSGGRITPPPTPTVTSCTNGSLASEATDNAAQIGFTGNSTTCTMTFNRPKLNNPVCTASNTGGIALSVGTTTTTVTIAGAFVNGLSLYVICMDSPA